MNRRGFFSKLSAFFVASKAVALSITSTTRDADANVDRGSLGPVRVWDSRRHDLGVVITLLELVQTAMVQIGILLPSDLPSGDELRVGMLELYAVAPMIAGLPPLTKVYFPTAMITGRCATGGLGFGFDDTFRRTLDQLADRLMPCYGITREHGFFRPVEFLPFRS